MGRDLPLLAESIGLLSVCVVAFHLAPAMATAIVVKQMRSKAHQTRRSFAASPAPVVVAIARVSSRAARVVPRTTCLSRATAAALMLRRRGIRAQLRVSAETPPTAGFSAHAWLESEGVLVVGPRGVGPEFALADE